jgi:hypothetical protein
MQQYLNIHLTRYLFMAEIQKKESPVKKASFKEFFRPTKQKIIAFLVLFLIFVTIDTLLFASLALSASPLLYAFVALVLSYFFGCYIDKTKKWIIMIFFYLIIMLVIVKIIFMVFTPTETLDASAFVKAGCTQEKYDGRILLDCSPAGFSNESYCSLRTASKSLKYLTPRDGIAECMFYGYRLNESEWDNAIKYLGCMVRRPIRYVVLKHNAFQLIKNKDEFKQFFGPVETKKEALSFAVALTDSYPLHSPFLFLRGTRPTYVKETPEGFKVHLFEYQGCGCEHPYRAIDYLVTREGDINQVSEKIIFESKLSSFCAD